MKKAILFTIALGAAATARADTWACEILLCMANPAGPTAAAACIPPIKKLWRELAKGHAFPRCDLGSSSGGAATYTEHTPASAENCLPAYRYWGGADNKELLCDLGGSVTTVVDGRVVSRVWWRSENETITEVLDGTQIQDGSAGFDRQ